MYLVDNSLDRDNEWLSSRFSVLLIRFHLNSTLMMNSV